MNIEEEKNTKRIQFYVRDKFKTQELWALLEKYEDDLEEASRDTKDDEDYKMIILRIVSRSLIVLREIIVLCEAGYPDDAFSLSRLLYEQCIHVLFFKIHENDPTFQNYTDDFLLNGAYQLYKYRRVNALYFSGQEQKQELLLDLKEMKERAHHTFPEEKPNDYWWAGYKRFGSMIQEIKEKYNQSEDQDILNRLYLLYMATNRFIHVNAAGNMQRLGYESKSNVINTSPNYMGQGLPLYFASLCMTIVIVRSCELFEMNSEYYKNIINDFSCYLKDNIYIFGGEE